MDTQPKVIAFPGAQDLARESSQICRAPEVLLGPSAAMTHLWSQIRRVAPYFRTALLTGERGAATEAVAEALHQLSPFGERALVVVEAEDAERKLTAHAVVKLAGQAVFLPEVERLSQEAQMGLLRLLRLRRPKQPCVIAAASGELRPRVSAGQFSGVLAQALGGLQLAVPPLRARREDIAGLVEYVLRIEAKALGLEPPVLAGSVFGSLIEQEWLGNLVQMQAVVRELVVTPYADVEALVRASEREVEKPVAPGRLLKLEQVVQEHVRAVLVGCHGNKLKAAEVLGISRSTLYRMLEAPPMAA